MRLGGGGSRVRVWVCCWADSATPDRDPTSRSCAVRTQVFETEDQEERYLGMSFHQPLVISMVAGFVVVNFTSSRRSFLRILHDSSEPVYIAFFTLTGMTLQARAPRFRLASASLPRVPPRTA